MNFVNSSGAVAGWTLGFERDGRELLVVVAKATYAIPEDPAQEPFLTTEQSSLTEADEFTGEPGLSAMLYETDFSHRKPKCDVLLNGSAYSPHGEPTKKVTVKIIVGPMRKSFDVIGDRIWDKTLQVIHATKPSPFIRMPISYDRAYGGVDVAEHNPNKRETYLDNPVGVGFYPLTKRKDLIGKPLANTAEVGKDFTNISGKYKPMAFGPIGRNFKSRFPLAGTYDKAWHENHAPFWPNDFDYAYFQAAPAEQQIPYLVGGEEVVLHNLTLKGETRFRIPVRTMEVCFVPHRGKYEQVNAVCDTLVIEPDKQRFSMTWRTGYALRRNMFELKEVAVGEMSRSWHRAQRGERKWKRHYVSLDELVRARQAQKQK